jgi:hypothetical protein
MGVPKKTKVKIHTCFQTASVRLSSIEFMVIIKLRALE